MSGSKKYSIEAILGIIIVIIVLCYGGFELFVYKKSSSDLIKMGHSAENHKNIFMAKLFYRLAVRKGSAKAMAGMGKLYLYQKNIPNALYWYEKAGNAGYSWGYGLMADIYEKQKNYQEAIKWYKKLGDAGNLYGYEKLGYLYKEQKNYPEAIKYFKKMGKYFNKTGNYQIFLIYKEQKNQKKIAELINEIIAKKDDYSLALVTSYYMNKEKNILEAIKYYTIAANGGSQRAINKLGKIYIDRKDYVNALKWYEKSNYKGTSTATFYLGICYENQKKYTKALKCYKEYLTYNKNSSGTREVLASVAHFVKLHKRKNTVDKAILFIKSIYIEGDLDYLIALGFIYDYTDNTTEAKKYFDKAVKYYEQMACKCLGELYHLAEEYSKAIKWYKSSKDSYSLSLIGDIYIDQKDYGNAFKYYKKSYDAGNSEGIIGMARCYEKQKDYVNALKWYKEGFFTEKITELEKKLAETNKLK